jgi:hypothetical protein
MSTDLKGRAWATVAGTKPGDIVVTDGDFLCLPAGQRCEVKADMAGDLYIDCDEGAHGLDGQEDPTGHHYVGLYPAGPV